MSCECMAAVVPAVRVRDFQMGDCAILRALTFAEPEILPGTRALTSDFHRHGDPNTNIPQVELAMSLQVLDRAMDRLEVLFKLIAA